jgi:hypothetical protein
MGLDTSYNNIINYIWLIVTGIAFTSFYKEEEETKTSESNTCNN